MTRRFVGAWVVAAVTAFASFQGATQVHGSDDAAFVPLVFVSPPTLHEIAPVGQIGSISVSLAGNGSGSVTSVDGRIACGATCRGLYSNTTVVTLNACPEADELFRDG